MSKPLERLQQGLAALLLLPSLASAADLLEVYAQARASDPVLAAADPGVVPLLPVAVPALHPLNF